VHIIYRWLEIAVLSQKVFQMEIAFTGSTLESHHIQRLHNSVWYEFKAVTSARDGVQRTLEYNKKTGNNSATKALEDCIAKLDLEVYELEFLLNYTEEVIRQVAAGVKSKEVTK